MPYFVFCFILIALILEDFIGIYLSGMRGLAFRNISIYFALVVLLPHALRSGWPKIPNAVPVAVIVFWTLVSLLAVHFYSPLDVDLFNNAIKFKNAILIIMLLYVIPFLTSRNPKESERFILILLGLFSFCCFLSVFQIVTGIKIFKVAMHYTESTRFTGFGNPNKTSYFLVFLTPLYYYFFHTCKQMAIKIFCSISICMIVLLILLSGSRGGLLCSAFTISMILVVFREKKLFLAGAAIGLLFLPLLFFNETASQGFASTIERFSLFFSGADATTITANRNVIWEALWKDYTSNWIYIFMGAGFGTVNCLGVHAPPHNWYLGELVQFGIFGLLFKLFVIGAFFHHILKGKRTQPTVFANIVMISMGAVLIGLLFTSMTGYVGLFVFTFGTMLTHLNHLNSLRWRRG